MWMLDGITPRKPWQPLSRVCHTESPFIFFPLKGRESHQGLLRVHMHGIIIALVRFHLVENGCLWQRICVLREPRVVERDSRRPTDGWIAFAQVIKSLRDCDV
jgi:hypothetical protein